MNISYNKPQTRKLVLWMTAGVLCGLVLGGWGINKILAAGSARVFITPVTANVPPDANLTVKIDSGTTQVGFAQVQLSFDPTLLQLTNEIVTTSPLTTIVGVTTRADANSSGKISIALALPPANVGMAPSGEFGIANLNFGAATSAADLATAVTVNTEGVQIVGMDETAMTIAGENAMVNVNPTVVTTSTPTPIPTPTPTGVPSPTPGVRGSATLTLVSVGQALTGQEWGVKVNLSSTELLSGADVVINFDPRRLSGVRFDDGKLLSDQTQVSINNGSGVVRLSETMPAGQGWSGDGTLGTLVFNPLAAGPVTLSPEYTLGAKNESNAIALTDGADILNQPSGLGATVYDRIWLKLHVVTPAQSTVSGQITDGVWVSAFVTDVSGYSGDLAADPTWVGLPKELWVKVSGFLRRKVSITPLAGENPVEAGSLAAGDLNDDGIINNVDLSLLYDQWFGTGSADYNGDGIVNSADHWILTHNFLATDE